jgi:hypothetical protein
VAAAAEGAGGAMAGLAPVDPVFSIIVRHFYCSKPPSSKMFDAPVTVFTILS